MILPDINVLVYAFRPEMPRHDAYRTWLEAELDGPTELALSEMTLTGFLRIVTNHKVFGDPAPMAVATTFVDRLRDARRSRTIAASPSTWELLGSWAATDAGLRGNLVPDAFLAALARSHGARLASADRGLARFPGVDLFDPAATT